MKRAQTINDFRWRSFLAVWLLVLPIFLVSHQALAQNAVCHALFVAPGFGQPDIIFRWYYPNSNTTSAPDTISYPNNLQEQFLGHNMGECFSIILDSAIGGATLFYEDECYGYGGSYTWLSSGLDTNVNTPDTISFCTPNYCPTYAGWNGLLPDLPSGPTTAYSCICPFNGGYMYTYTSTWSLNGGGATCTNVSVSSGGSVVGGASQAFNNSALSGYSYDTLYVRWDSVGTQSVTLSKKNVNTQCYREQTLTVNVIPPPSGNVTADFGFQTNNSLTATFSDSSSGIIDCWLWDLGDGTTSTLQNPQHTYAVPGTYEVCLMVASGNNCTSDTLCDSVTAAGFIVTIDSTSDITCAGGNDGSISVSPSLGTPPYSYLWSSGGTGSTEANLSVGTYTVTVTDANGLTGWNSYFLPQPIPIHLIGNAYDVSCFGGTDGKIYAATYGVNPLSYLWSHGDTLEDAFNLSAGTYTLTVTDGNGCTKMKSWTVDEPTALAVVANGFAGCNSNNGYAQASASGGSSPWGLSYDWSNGGQGWQVTGLSPGTYTVTLTDNKGCTATDSTTVLSPVTLSATGTVVSNVSCNGGNDGEAFVTGTGGTLPYTFTWFSTGDTTASVNNLTAGNHTVKVSDQNNCAVYVFMSISEPAQLQVNLSSTNVSTLGGSDGSATASAGGGITPYSFLWSTGDTTTTINGLVAGTYTIVLTDSNGCTDVDSVIIHEPSGLPLATAISNSSNASCNGAMDGTATAQASGGFPPYTFLWSSGDTSATATGLAAGTFTVTVTDGNADTAMSSAAVSEPSALTNTVSTMQVNCYGGSDGSATAQGSGGTTPYNFAWSSGGTSATEAGLSAGTYSVTITDNNGCAQADNVTISEPALLVATISSSVNVSCYGSNDGIATAAGSGGTPGYAFQWSSGGTASTETGLTVGTHTVTVTDVNACTATHTVTIQQPTVLTASITSSTNVSCNGGNDGSATTLGTGGTPSYSFLWSTGSASTTATGLSSGTYTVTLTDNNGCTDEEVVIISEPSPVIASIVSTTDVSCFGGSDGLASTAATGGSAPYIYTWSSGASGASISGLTAGTYTVTVADATGCLGSTSATISEPNALVATIANKVDVSCFGANDGQVTASGSGGTTPYSYSWSSGGNLATETNMPAGSYFVTVADQNGCIASDQVAVNQPSLLVAVIDSAKDITCKNASDGTALVAVSGGVHPYTYSWSSGGGGAVELGMSAGSFTVTVLDGNGCLETASAILSEPLELIVQVDSSVDASCNNFSDGSATAVANGGTLPYQYLWSSGGTANHESGLSAGTYQITVTDHNGCQSSTGVAINEPPEPAVSILFDTTHYCQLGEQIQLTGTPAGGTFSGPGVDGQLLDQAVPGVGTAVVSYTATDSLGCEGTAVDSVEILPNPITGVINGPATAQSGNPYFYNVTASSGSAYDWQVTDGTLISSAGGVASVEWPTGNLNGSVKVIETAINGCQNSSILAVQVNFPTGLDEAEGLGSLSIFPNPANDQLNIKAVNWSGRAAVQIQVLSLQGQLLSYQKLDSPASEWQRQLDVSRLASGTYLVSIASGGQSVVQRFSVY